MQSLESDAKDLHIMKGRINSATDLALVAKVVRECRANVSADVAVKKVAESAEEKAAWNRLQTKLGNRLDTVKGG